MMTVTVRGTCVTAITAWNVDPKNPDAGKVISTGIQQIVLDNKEADMLGRFLLFNESVPTQPLELAPEVPEAPAE